MSEQKVSKPKDKQRKDPKEAGPKPPYPKQQQSVPGSEAEMTPDADHGEHSYRGSGKLKDKVAVITGADSGIGRAVAIAFAREGADVVISYLNEEEDAKETERWVKEAGRKALRIPGDISDEKHCRQIIQRTVDQFGKIDVLVNNAAYQMTFESLDEITAEEFERTFRVNIFAMFYLCKEAMRHMQPGGSIINTTSIQAYQPSGNLLPYATTKGAIENFTKGLAELAIEKGIRVNAVAPGPVWTPLIPSTMPLEKVANFGKNTPIGRAAQPAELAPVYVLLGSDEASYITAAIYEVTGGRPTS